jgi:hypothetical protein
MATLNLGGGYSIDMIDAEKFVKALQDTKDRLADTLQNTAGPLRVRPPGNDDYSGVLANTYDQATRQHADWNMKKQAELQELIDRVTAMLASYRETEHNNTMKD